MTQRCWTGRNVLAAKPGPVRTILAMIVTPLIASTRTMIRMNGLARPVDTNDRPMMNGTHLCRGNAGNMRCHAVEQAQSEKEHTRATRAFLTLANPRREIVQRPVFHEKTKLLRSTLAGTCLSK